MDIEQVRDATTANDMRAEIFRLRRENPLVRAVMDTADINGLSAEDRYTMLAYHALKGYAEMQKMLLDQFQTMPAPVVFRPGPIQPTPPASPVSQ